MDIWVTLFQDWTGVVVGLALLALVVCTVVKTIYYINRIKSDKQFDNLIVEVGHFINDGKPVYDAMMEEAKKFIEENKKEL